MTLEIAKVAITKSSPEPTTLGNLCTWTLDFALEVPPFLFFGASCVPGRRALPWSRSMSEQLFAFMSRL